MWQVRRDSRFVGSLSHLHSVELNGTAQADQGREPAITRAKVGRNEHMARPGLTGHRKFRRLARTLGSAILARGVLELLWEPSYESGDDYVGTSDDIENLVGWTGERGVLTNALLEAGAPEGFGFIEPVDLSLESGQMRLGSVESGRRFKIHDLWHHAPDYVMKRRERELERRQKTSPKLNRRRTAPDGGHWTESAECQIESDRTPAPAHAPAPAPAHAPVVSAQDVVDLWNEVVTRPIPRADKLTSGRETKINARLRVYPDLNTWRTVIVWINGQDWCRASGRGDHPNWTATLDWLVKSDDAFQKNLERVVAAQETPVRGTPPWVCPHMDRCSNRGMCANKNLLPHKYPVKAAAS